MGPPRGTTCISPHYLDIKWLFFQCNGPNSKCHGSKWRSSLLPVTMTMGHWEIQEASNTQCTPTSSLSALDNTKGLERTRGSRKGVSYSLWAGYPPPVLWAHGWLVTGFWKLLALPVLPWRLALRNQYLSQASGYRWKTLCCFFFFLPFWFFETGASWNLPRCLELFTTNMEAGFGHPEQILQLVSLRKQQARTTCPVSTGVILLDQTLSRDASCSSSWLFSDPYGWAGPNSLIGHLSPVGAARCPEHLRQSPKLGQCHLLAQSWPTWDKTKVTSSIRKACGKSTMLADSRPKGRNWVYRPGAYHLGKGTRSYPTLFSSGFRGKVMPYSNLRINYGHYRNLI